jgi:membrane-associated phospholipid phosphatase
MNLDAAGVAWFHAHQSPFVNTLTTGISSVTSSDMCCLWAGLIAIGFMLRRHYTRGAILFFGTVLSALLVEGLKLLFGRDRPPFSSILDSYSFPSGHALTSTVFFGLAAWAFSRSFPSRQKALYWNAAELALLVGLSRLYLGVHWPSDILGGFLIGFLFIWGWLWLLAYPLNTRPRPLV